MDNKNLSQLKLNFKYNYVFFLILFFIILNLLIFFGINFPLILNIL